MPRAVSNVPRLKRKKQIMKAARGAFGARSKLWKPAKENVERGWKYAYRDRKNKKRDFRRLWITRINAGAHQHDMNYNTFINGLKLAGHRSESEDPRRSRRPRSRRVYGARREGALRAERSVSGKRDATREIDPSTSKLGGGSATSVVLPPFSYATNAPTSPA